MGKYTVALLVGHFVMWVEIVFNCVGSMLKKRFVVIILFFFAPVCYSLELKQLISLTIATHPSVYSEEFNVKSGEADVDSAEWQFYPTPNIELRTGDSEDPSTVDVDGVAAVVSLEQPLWTGGRLSGGLDRAEAIVGARQLELAQTQRDLALNVVEVYGDWLSSNLRATAWEESLATHFLLKTSVAKRLAVGVASKSDELLASSRFESVVAQVSTARVGKEVALSSLAQLVGNGVELKDLKASLNPPKLYGNVQAMTKQALIISPLVLQSLAQVEVAKAELSVQKSERWPDVFLRAEHQYNSTPMLGESHSDSRIFIGTRTSFGAGLSSFTGTKALRYAYESRLAAVDSERRNVEQQIRGDSSLSESFRVQIPALESSVNTTEEVFESYNRQYLQGRKTWFDLLNSARDLVQVKVQLADAQASYLVVNWRLAIMTQSLNDLIAMNEAEGG